MEANKFIIKIRKYSVISFLLPLITINSCLLIFKLLGDIDIYPRLNWDQNKVKIVQTYAEYESTTNSPQNFLDCPKYNFTEGIVTTDGEVLSEEEIKRRENLEENKLQYVVKLNAANKIKSKFYLYESSLNQRCVKNKKISYFLLSKFNFLEEILLYAKKNTSGGFSKIKNPYLYGEVSISRTARFFPSNLIFKSLIILSVFFLFLYWRNNLNLFKELENKNILNYISKKFFYLGLLSCVFLFLHAALLGIDFDSKIFRNLRKLIIALFIVFEVAAQILLTQNLYKFRDKLKKYTNLTIIKIKVFFVSIVLSVTVIIFLILIFKDISSEVKFILEWNYFTIILVYYFFSRLLWKTKQT